MVAIGRNLRSLAVSDHPLPWLLPLIAMLAVFTIYPLFYNIWLSFHEYAPFQRQLVYVGWENWGTLFSDARLWESLRVTFVYFAAALAIELTLGMALALLLDYDGPGFGLLRALLTLTLVIPPAITGMMFLLMQDPEFGVLSYVLELFGILDSTTPILATSSTALAGVILADVWQWTPFMVLIFLAGLRSLPTEPYEAAMLDGASAIQIFRRITLPLMSRVIAHRGADPRHRSLPRLRLRLRDDLGRSGDLDLYAQPLRLAADLQLHQVGATARQSAC